LASEYISQAASEAPSTAPASPVPTAASLEEPSTNPATPTNSDETQDPSFGGACSTMPSAPVEHFPHESLTSKPGILKEGCITLPVVPIPKGDAPVHGHDPGHVFEPVETRSAKDSEMVGAVEPMSISQNAATETPPELQAQDKPDCDPITPASHASHTLGADSPTDSCTLRAEISCETPNAQVREPSPEPDVRSEEGDAGTRPFGTATFAEQLAAATQGAPQKLAERLADQLKDFCIEEAGMGLNSCTWDVPIPSNKRSFVNQVAREFALQVETFGFVRIDWWNGREWKQSQGRYHILHDTVYDKYHMRLRVRWPERLPTDEYATHFQHHDQQNSLISEAPGALLEQIQQTLDLQRQMLEAAIINYTQLCPAPERRDSQDSIERSRKQVTSHLPALKEESCS